jgi:hypothetical protein
VEYSRGDAVAAAMVRYDENRRNGLTHDGDTSISSHQKIRATQFDGYASFSRAVPAVLAAGGARA